MAMGRRQTERHEALCVEVEELVRAEGRTFYTALNELSTEHAFDRFCEERVASEHAGALGSGDRCGSCHGT
jgi:hypothetical protein